MRHFLIPILMLALTAAMASAQETAGQAAVMVADGASPAGAEPEGFTSRDAEGLRIDDFLWTNRLVIVFADSPSDPQFQLQIDRLEDGWDALQERDVVIITDTDPEAGSEIRNELRPRGFSLVLVDKDGELRQRKPLPWSVREISHTIDKTALRRQEMLDARSGRM